MRRLNAAYNAALHPVYNAELNVAHNAPPNTAYKYENRSRLKSKFLYGVETPLTDVNTLTTELNRNVDHLNLAS